MRAETDSTAVRRPLLCLAMVVRNESRVIERALRSARPWIDAWIVVDTGSTDDTPAIVERVLDPIPGRLFHSPWASFGQNRSELLDLARGQADWFLILDADMEFRGDSDLWATLVDTAGVDAYMVPVIEGEFYYHHPLLISADVNWRYQGVTHEYLTTDYAYERRLLPGVHVLHHADGGFRADKLERDRRLLESALADEPDDPRTVFYLAQTFRDLGLREQAIVLYQRRSDMGGWDEEVFYARYQIGLLLSTVDWPRGRSALLDAWRSRPERLEPLYHLAVEARRHEEWADAYVLVADHVDRSPPAGDVLFVDGWIYRFGILFERSLAARALGLGHRALVDTLRLAALTDLPEPWHSQVHANLILLAAEARVPR